MKKPGIIIIFTTRAYHGYDTFHSNDNDALIQCALDYIGAAFVKQSSMELNIFDSVRPFCAVHINFATR